MMHDTHNEIRLFCAGNTFHLVNFIASFDWKIEKKNKLKYSPSVLLIRLRTTRKRCAQIYTMSAGSTWKWNSCHVWCDVMWCDERKIDEYYVNTYGTFDSSRFSTECTDIFRERVMYESLEGLFRPIRHITETMIQWKEINSIWTAQEMLSSLHQSVARKLTSGLSLSLSIHFHILYTTGWELLRFFFTLFVAGESEMEFQKEFSFNQDPNDIWLSCSLDTFMNALQKS